MTMMMMMNDDDDVSHYITFVYTSSIKGEKHNTCDNVQLLTTVHCSHPAHIPRLKFCVEVKVVVKHYGKMIICEELVEI